MRCAAVVALTGLLMVWSPAAPGTSATASASVAGQVDPLLARSRAIYPAVSSYADTGTVVAELSGTIDRGIFKTYFRQPLDFYFEYTSSGTEFPELKQSVPGSSHLVLWMLGGEVQTWNKELQSHETVSRESGLQVAALTAMLYATQATAVLIPSLILAQANIRGPIQEVVSLAAAGSEQVGGRKCHKLTGIAQSVYPTGQVTNIRPITIWIDAETQLIRKVFEDTPKGYPLGQISRRTVTYDPQLNPPLDDGKFHFKVPNSQ